MKVNRVELLQTLDRVRPALGTEMAEFKMFVFHRGYVMAYNDEIVMACPLSLDVDIEGALPADEFYKLIKKIKHDELDIDLSEGTLKIKAGKGRARVVSVNAEMPPQLESVFSRKRWRHLPGNFISLAGMVAGACSPDRVNPITSTVYMTSDNLQASDQYKIAVGWYKDEPVRMKDPALIPASTMKLAVKLKPVRVAFTPGWVHFETDYGLYIAGRTFNDNFPSLLEHVDFTGRKFEFPEDTVDMIDAAGVFAQGIDQYDRQIILTFTAGKLIIRGEGDVGWFEEEAAVEYSGGNLRAALPVYVLVDILKETRVCTLGKRAIKFEGDDWVYGVAFEQL